MHVQNAMGRAIRGFAWPQGLALIAGALLVLSSSAFGDAVVVVGAGRVGNWTTQVELANPSDAELRVQVGGSPFFEQACATPPPCPFASATIAPKGSVILDADAIFPFAADGLHVMFVVSEDGITLPTVRARVIDLQNPALAVELPAVRQSTLAAEPSRSLVFPSVKRTSVAHSNLILGNVSLAGPRSMTVDAYSTEGALLGTMEVTLDPLETVFFVNVLPKLGVSALENGQIVVSQTGGTGNVWGIVATVDDINGVIISPGWNP